MNIMISKNKIKNELIKTKWKKEYFEKKKNKCDYLDRQSISEGWITVVEATRITRRGGGYRGAEEKRKKEDGLVP